MLKALRTGLGFRVAMAIAVFAAFCLVAPPAVMAFGHGNNTVHCLVKADMADHGMHGSSAPKHHSDHGQPSTTGAPGCCGLFCLSALPLALGAAAEGPPHPPALSPPAEILSTGTLSSRLDRPPISFPSV
jgi:hypothetical protein